MAMAYAMDATDPNEPVTPSLVFTAEQRALWNSKSVEELHALELRLRNESDEKREELRQLVGLKYRDLIQSADSIVHMKEIAFGALQNLQLVSDTLNAINSKNQTIWTDESGKTVAAATVALTRANAAAAAAAAAATATATGSTAAPAAAVAAPVSVSVATPDASAIAAATSVLASFFDAARAVAASSEQIWSLIAEFRFVDSCRVYFYALSVYQRLMKSENQISVRKAFALMNSSNAAPAQPATTAAATDEKAVVPASKSPIKPATASGTAASGDKKALSIATGSVGTRSAAASASAADPAAAAAAATTIDQVFVFLYQQRITLSQFPALIGAAAQRRLLTRTDRVTTTTPVATTAVSESKDGVTAAGGDSAARSVGVSDYADALAGISILSPPAASAPASSGGAVSGSAMAQVLSRFLNSRTVWCTRVLMAAVSAITRFPNANPAPTVSHVLASVTRTLQCTITHAAQLFAIDSQNSVSAVLQSFKSSMAAAHIPIPAIDDTRLISFTLRNNCGEWLAACQKRMTGVISQILSHLTTCGQLTAVRDAIIQTLCFVDQFQAQPPSAAAAAAAAVAAAAAGTAAPEVASAKSNGAQSNGVRPPHAAPSIAAGVDKKGDAKAVPAAPAPVAAAVGSGKQRRAAVDELLRVWSDHSIQTVGRVVDVWNDWYRPLFVARVKALVSRQTETLTTLHRSVERVLAKWFPPAASDAKAAVPDAADVKSATAGGELETKELTIGEPDVKSPGRHKRMVSGVGTSIATANGVAAATKPVTATPTASAVVSGGANHTSRALTLELSTIVNEFDAQLIQLQADLLGILRCRYVAAPASSRPAAALAASGGAHARKPSASALDQKGGGGGGGGGSDVDSEAAWETVLDVNSSLHRMLNDELTPFVRHTVTQNLTTAFAALRQQLTALQTASLDAAQPTHALRLVDQAVFIGRICKRLLTQSVALKSLVSAYAVAPNAAASAGKPVSGAGAAAPNYVEGLLQETAAFAFRIWSGFVASTLGDEFRRELSGWFKQWGSDPTLTSTWQRVATTADAPAAGGGGSAMSLPSHVSPHVMSFLFAVTTEVYRVHGSEVDTHTLRGLINDVASVLITLHDNEWQSHVRSVASTAAAAAAASPTAQSLQQRRKVSSSPLCEPAAIQFAFDAQFLFSIVRLPDTATAAAASAAAGANASELDGAAASAAGATPQQRLNSLLAAVEACVDPINWQECAAPLRSRVQRLTSRCTVLFGTLLQLAPTPIAATPTPASASAARAAAGTAAAATAAAAASNKSGGVESGEAANIMPIAASSFRVAPFRTTLYPTKRFQQQNRAAVKSPVAAAN